MKYGKLEEPLFIFNPVSTPRVTSRSDAWKAWYSSLINEKYKRKIEQKRKKEEVKFWSALDTLNSDLFEITGEWPRRGQIRGVSRETGNVEVIDIFDSYQVSLIPDGFLHELKFREDRPELEEAYQSAVQNLGLYGFTIEDLLLMVEFPILMETKRTELIGPYPNFVPYWKKDDFKIKILPYRGIFRVLECRRVYADSLQGMYRAFVKMGLIEEVLKED